MARSTFNPAYIAALILAGHVGRSWYCRYKFTRMLSLGWYGGIALDPANVRVFVRFKDARGTNLSVASGAITVPAAFDAPVKAASPSPSTIGGSSNVSTLSYVSPKHNLHRKRALNRANLSFLALAYILYRPVKRQLNIINRSSP